MTCDCCSAPATNAFPPMCDACYSRFRGYGEPEDEAVTPIVYRAILSARSVRDVCAAFRKVA